MGKKVYFDVGFVLYLALFLLTVPLYWVGAYLIASLIHELGHVAAVKLFGSSISEVTIGMRGAKIVSDLMPPWKTAACILCGPAASLGLFAVRRLFPRIAICGAIQGIYNLIPLGSLDGGRLVQVIRSQFCCRAKITCKDSKERVQ